MTEEESNNRMPPEEFLEYAAANSLQEFWNKKAHFENEDTNPPAG